MNRRILNLAIPNIISNLSVPLLGMVDIAMLGRLDSQLYIGAISLGGIVFSFIYWIFSFLRMGTSGMVAQSFGEKDMKKSYRILLRAIIVALVIAFFLISIQDFIGFISFIFLDGSLEVEQLAFDYFSIRIFAAPATLLLYVFSGWFIGMQNSKYPMFITIAVNIVNLILNYYFIFHANMNVKGVAWGTLLAQYFGLLLALCLFLLRYRSLIYRVALKVIFKKNELVKFLIVNKDLFIRTMCIIVAIASFTNLSAKQGDNILAVNTILLQFFYMFAFFADGFAYAAEALTGRYMGEGNILNLNKLIKRIFIWGASIAIIASLVFYFGGSSMLELLTTDNEILKIANQYFIWCVSIPILSFASFIWDGIFVGATDSSGLKRATVSALLLVFAPIVFFFYDKGNDYLWLAFVSFLLARGIYQTLFYKRIYKFVVKQV